MGKYTILDGDEKDGEIIFTKSTTYNQMNETNYIPQRSTLETTLIFMFPAFFLLAFIHETGHILMALITGANVLDLEVSIIFFRESFVNINSVNLPYQGTLILISGSLLTFVIGNVAIIIAYKKKLSRNIEIFLFLYWAILASDVFIYNLLDCFVYQKGDWYEIFKTMPIINLIVTIIMVAYIILLTKNYDKFLKEINL